MLKEIKTYATSYEQARLGINCNENVSKSKLDY